MKRSPLKRTGRFKKKARKPLRCVSKKRAKRNREVKDFRIDLKREVGCCEICRKQTAILDCHEIARGGSRSLALDCRYAILVLCRDCHEATNDYPATWTVARQASILRESRPQDFDLPALNALLTRKIEIEDVDSVLRTTKGRKRA